jgi:hypothetical protein
MAVSKPPSFSMANLLVLRHTSPSDGSPPAVDAKKFTPGGSRSSSVEGAFLGGLVKLGRPPVPSGRLRVLPNASLSFNAIQLVAKPPTRGFDEITDEEAENWGDESLACLSFSNQTQLDKH